MTVTEHVLPDAVLPPRVHTSIRVGAGQLCTGQAKQNKKELKLSFYDPVSSSADALIKKKIKLSSDTKSNMTNALLKCITKLYMVKYLRISSYIRKPFLIYDFAPDPI
jgi:hypothetical protein